MPVSIPAHTAVGEISLTRRHSIGLTFFSPRPSLFLSSSLTHPHHHYLFGEASPVINDDTRGPNYPSYPCCLITLCLEETALLPDPRLPWALWQSVSLLHPCLAGWYSAVQNQHKTLLYHPSQFGKP